MRNSLLVASLASLLTLCTTVSCTRKISFNLDNTKLEFVRVPKPLEASTACWIQTTETSWDQMAQYYRETNPRKYHTPLFENPERKNLPSTVSPREAMDYCKWVSARIGRKVSLPDAYQRWEASIAGFPSKLDLIDEFPKLIKRPEYNVNNPSGAVQVKSGKPNKLGIYHGFGNVKEIVPVNDLFLADGYSFISDPKRDGFKGIAEEIKEDTQEEDTGFRLSIQ